MNAPVSEQYLHFRARGYRAALALKLARLNIAPDFWDFPAHRESLNRGSKR